MTPLDAALAWQQAGCGVCPPTQDGSKRPAGGLWKDRQRVRADEDQIQRWYRSGQRTGVGLICGAISGNLELMELEGRATSSESLDKIVEQCEKLGVLWLWELLNEDGYVEVTPSGGFHFLYRVDGETVPGNTKLACRPATPEELAAKPKDRIKTLAETRGEGGYVIVAPSHGTVHPTGESWSLLVGEAGRVPTIGWDDRCALHEALKLALNEMPDPPEYKALQAPVYSGDALRPGDDFNLRASWDDILKPHGWKIHHQTKMETFWTRPGKERSQGWSATTGYAGVGAQDRLYIWSTSVHAGFRQEVPYTKFAAYTILNHGIDYGAAAKELSRMGYGQRREAVYETGTLAVGSPPDATGQQLVASSFDAKALKPVVNERLFSTFRWDELGAADMWVNTFGSHITYVHSTKSWIFFDGKRWAQANMKIAEYAARQLVEGMNIYASEVADEELAKNLRKSAKALSSNSKIKGIVEQASNDPRANSYIDSFDKDPNLLCLDNGVLNLTTMQLGGHDPKLMQRGKLNASFDPDTGTGRWEQFITQLFPDPQVRDYVQRAFGYMLLGVPDERVMFMLFGPSGTGKTQLLEAIRVVMGDFAGVAPASAFEPRQRGYKGPSEDLHKLMGTRFVIQSELDASAALNEPLIKSIVGADTQTTRPLYGQPVDWTPQYVVFLATNFLPSLSSSDDAIWNRIKAIKMDNVFVDERGRPTDPAFKNIGRKLADECAPEILNWLLTGLSAYRERGLTEPEQVSSWVDQYRDEVDTTRQFIKEAAEDGRIVVAPAEQSVSRELHKAYLEWAADNSIKPLGLRKFNERLESSGWVKERRDKGACWQGIGVIGRFTSTIYPPGHWPRQ